MNPLLWLCAAGALACAAPISRAPSRMRTLALHGRLDSRVEPALRRRLAQLPLVAFGCAASAALGVLAWLRIGPAVAVAGVGLGLAVTSLLRAAGVRRQAVATKRTLREAVHLIVAELEAGSAPASALDAAAQVTAGSPHAAVLSEAARFAARGEPFGGVMVGSQDGLAALGRAWVVADTAGIAPADVLARVAADLDAELTQERTVSAALAGPRSSAFMLAGLPALGLVLGNAMGTAPFSFLAGGRVGQLVCCAGVLLDVAGALWTQHMIERAART